MAIGGRGRKERLADIDTRIDVGG
jgi:hypothetical protein